MDRLVRHRPDLRGVRGPDIPRQEMSDVRNATYVQSELATADPSAQRGAAYLNHVAAAGGHPRLAALFAGFAEPTDPADRFGRVLGRALNGLLA